MGPVIGQQLPPGYEDDNRACDGPLARIRAERLRQVAVEGWTPEHDLDHDQGQLADAAACYAMTSLAWSSAKGLRFYLWPFEEPCKRDSKDRDRQLIVAGALIVAELERLARDK